jgi:cysteinyl-tRNA synthetase
VGILQAEPAAFLQASVGAEIDSAEIDRLVAARDQARADKDWGKADEIRDQLTALKVVVEDGAAVSTWRIEA